MSDMTRKHRHFSPEDKVRILKRHLAERESISDICESEQIAPTQFYAWQKTFFEQGAAAFQRENVKNQQAQAKEVEDLKTKLRRKNVSVAVSRFVWLPPLFMPLSSTGFELAVQRRVA
jgi:transposase-like protein